LRFLFVIIIIVVIYPAPAPGPAPGPAPDPAPDPAPGPAPRSGRQDLAAAVNWPGRGALIDGKWSFPKGGMPHGRREPGRGSREPGRGSADGPWPRDDPDPESSWARYYGTRYPDV